MQVWKRKNVVLFVFNFLILEKCFQCVDEREPCRKILFSFKWSFCPLNWLAYETDENYTKWWSYFLIFLLGLVKRDEDVSRVNLKHWLEHKCTYIKEPSNPRKQLMKYNTVHATRLQHKHYIKQQNWIKNQANRMENRQKES